MDSALSLCSASSPRVLVTGASGFVGRHLVLKTLRSLDVEVIACDLRAPDAATVQELTPEVAGRFHCLALDVRDTAACAQLLRQARPTHVIHGAAITAGDERTLMDVNLRGTQNLLEAALAADSSVERLLLLSSSAVYGSPEGELLCDELHPLDLRGAYARSKRSAEEYLLECAAGSPVSLVAARLGPCFGPGEVAGPYRPSISLVARLMEALEAGTPVSVGGEDYSRDWTHLDEVHDASMGLLFATQLESHLYNVSSGEPVSAYELVRCFEDHGLRVEWTDEARAVIQLRAQDGRKPLAIGRLQRDTGFAPSKNWRQRITELITSRAAVQQSGRETEPWQQ